jgi:hypothetical protein
MVEEHCEREAATCIKCFGANVPQVSCVHCSEYICTLCHWCPSPNHDLRGCDCCDQLSCSRCSATKQCEGCDGSFCTDCDGTCNCVAVLCRECSAPCRLCRRPLCGDCSCACPQCEVRLCPEDTETFAEQCDSDGCSGWLCLLCIAKRVPCNECNEPPSRAMRKVAKRRLQVRPNTSHCTSASHPTFN